MQPATTCPQLCLRRAAPPHVCRHICRAHAFALVLAPIPTYPHYYPIRHISLQVPYFNAPIYLENKTQVGKVEEILGVINNVVGTLAHCSRVELLF